MPAPELGRGRPDRRWPRGSWGKVLPEPLCRCVSGLGSAAPCPSQNLSLEWGGHPAVRSGRRNDPRRRWLIALRRPRAESRKQSECNNPGLAPSDGPPGKGSPWREDFPATGPSGPGIQYKGGLSTGALPHPRPGRVPSCSPADEGGCALAGCGNLDRDGPDVQCSRLSTRPHKWGGIGSRRCCSETGRGRVIPRNSSTARLARQPRRPPKDPDRQ